MSIGVVFYFDDSTNEKIHKLWKILYDRNICREMIDSGSYPHVSLAAFDYENKEEIINRARQFAKTIKKFTMTFSSIGCFPGDAGIVYLAPKATIDLLHMHESFYSFYGDADFRPNRLYMPKLLVPHCTMTYNIDRENTLKAIDVLLDELQPFEAVVSSIGFAEFYPIKYLKDKVILLE
ncbi:MAG: 2'-5' RNA ligase family protein [Bacillota bacterium]